MHWVGGGGDVRKRDKNPPSIVWIYVYYFVYFFFSSIVPLKSGINVSTLMCKTVIIIINKVFLNWIEYLINPFAKISTRYRRGGGGWAREGHHQHSPCPARYREGGGGWEWARAGSSPALTLPCQIPRRGGGWAGSSPALTLRCQIPKSRRRLSRVMTNSKRGPSRTSPGPRWYTICHS